MAETSSAIDRFPGQKLLRANGPLYQQLADLIQSLIASGSLEVGADLPKEAELEDRLGVSLITVRRALRELEYLGLIEKRSAKPSRVIAQRPGQRGGYRFATYEDLTDFTRGAQLVVDSFEAIRTPLFDKYFSLAEGQTGYCLRGYLSVGDQKQTVVTTLFPPDIGAQLSAGDFTDVLIFRNVERCLGLKIDRVLVSARAEVANKKIARQLSVAPGNALMTTEMVYISAGRSEPVEVTITSTPSELFTLSYDIVLNQP